MSQPSNDYDYEEKFQESLSKMTSNSLKQKLVAIKNLVVKRLNLEKEFKGLQYKLDAKYEELYKPFYVKRSKIIEGSQEVSVDDIKTQLEKLTLKEANPTNSETGIPSFWVTAIKHTAQFGQDVNEKDEKVLSFLKDITCDLKENGSFTLNFCFNENPYFDQSVITREYILDSEKFLINKINSTKIEWKSDDLNPTVEKKKKKIKSI
jgi:hypothetical protein